MDCTTEVNLLNAALKYHSRGWSLLPLNRSTKKAALESWSIYQKTPADEKQIRRWFDGAKHDGLAVITGGVSGDLFVRDFDDIEGVELYDEWSRTHEELARRLPTVKTGKGYHVYSTVAREHMAEVRRSFNKLGTGHINVKGGELRCGIGCYCALPPTIHENGRQYEWIVPLSAEKPPKIDLFLSELCAKPIKGNDTEITEITELTDDIGKGGRSPRNGSSQGRNGANQGKNWGNQRKKTAGRSFSVQKDSDADTWSDAIHEAIIGSIPTGPGKRHEQVFELARALKAVPELADKKARELKPFVKRWHEIAYAKIRTKSFELTWVDFREGWDKVIFPKGTNGMSEILERARQQPVPKEAEEYESDGVKLLASVCRELQRATGDDAFYLSCRTAAGMLDVEFKTANRWLRLLEMDEVLKVTKRGKQGSFKANRFRYLGQLT